jgi:hypothetical protein
MGSSTKRQVFGLKASTSLICRRLRDTLRRTSPHLRAYQAAGAEALRGLSPEERHRPRGQPISLEESRQRRASPTRKAAWARRHDQFVQGTWTPPAPRDRRAAARAGGAGLRRKLEDPAYRARSVARIAERRGGPAAITCVVCGTEVRLAPSRARGRRTCGQPACLQ